MSVVHAVHDVSLLAEYLPSLASQLGLPSQMIIAGPSCHLAPLLGVHHPAHALVHWVALVRLAQRLEVGILLLCAVNAIELRSGLVLLQMLIDYSVTMLVKCIRIGVHDV